MARITDLNYDEYSILKVALSKIKDEYNIYMKNNLINDEFKTAEYWRNQKETAEELLKELEISYWR